MLNKPDFLCIGFEKAGTGWLYEMLNDHPEVEMPPVKELRYLAEGSIIPSVSLVKQYSSNHWHYGQFQRLLRMKMRSWLKNPNAFRKDIWYRKFLLHKHSDDWYRGLFSSTKVSGDITPTYTNLSPVEIKRIKQRFPELKIIILLRHPIERHWSKMKMNLSKHTSVPIDSISEEVWTKEADRFVNLGFTPSQVIKQWSDVFNKVYVGFYDEIGEDPETLLKNICTFLALNDTKFNGWNLKKKVNVGLSKDMPKAVVKTLEDAASKEIHDLVNLLGDQVPKSWTTSIN